MFSYNFLSYHLSFSEGIGGVDPAKKEGQEKAEKKPPYCSQQNSHKHSKPHFCLRDKNRLLEHDDMGGIKWNSYHVEWKSFTEWKE